MAGHNTLTGSELHEPKGIESALLGTVYVANGAGSGAWTDLIPSIVFVNEEADFPIQDATTITLAAQTIHVVAAPITTAKRFIVQDEAILTSFNILGPTLTYTGTGSMFTCTDASFIIRDIRIDHPNAQGFSFTDSVGGTKLFLASYLRTNSGTKFGTFNNPQTVLITDSSALDIDSGISLTGSGIRIHSLERFYMGTTSATFKGVDLGTSISQTTEITDLVIDGPSGAIGISGLAASGNIPAGRIAAVSNCDIASAVTPLQNITTSDIRWRFSGNSQIQDTIEDALVSLNNNLTNTTITTVNVPVKIAGTWVVERQSHFTCNTTGRVTYTGEKPIIVPVDISAAVESASGTNKDIKVFLAKNGTVITNSAKTSRVSAGDPKNVVVPWQVSLAQNDYLEVFVANATDTVALLIKTATLRVK